MSEDIKREYIKRTPILKAPVEVWQYLFKRVLLYDGDEIGTFTWYMDDRNITYRRPNNFLYNHACCLESLAAVRSKVIRKWVKIRISHRKAAKTADDNRKINKRLNKEGKVQVEIIARRGITGTPVVLGRIAAKQLMQRYHSSRWGSVGDFEKELNNGLLYGDAQAAYARMGLHDKPIYLVRPLR